MNGKQDMKKAFVVLLHAKQWAEISSVTEREWKRDQERMGGMRAETLLCDYKANSSSYRSHAGGRS